MFKFLSTVFILILTMIFNHDLSYAQAKVDSKTKSKIQYYNKKIKEKKIKENSEIIYKGGHLG